MLWTLHCISPSTLLPDEMFVCTVFLQCSTVWILPQLDEVSWAFSHFADAEMDAPLDALNKIDGADKVTREMIDPLLDATRLLIWGLNGTRMWIWIFE